MSVRAGGGVGAGRPAAERRSMRVLVVLVRHMGVGVAPGPVPMRVAVHRHGRHA